MTVGFLASALTSRLDPRIGMSAGFLMQVVSGAWMLSFDLNVTMEILILNSLVQGFAVGLIWVPLSVVAFDTLAADDRAGAAAAFHRLRNLGSSFFISLSIAERAGNRGQLQPDVGDDFPLQHHAGTAPGRP